MKGRIILPGDLPCGKVRADRPLLATHLIAKEALRMLKWKLELDAQTRIAELRRSMPRVRA